jgi:hypothetical protein
MAAPPPGNRAFGMGTVLLTAVELHWAPLAQTRLLMIMVLAFVAPLELISGLFASPARDAGAATGLSLVGAAWAAAALTVLRGPPRAQHGTGRFPADDDGHHGGAVRGVPARQAGVRRAAPARSATTSKSPSLTGESWPRAARTASAKPRPEGPGGPFPPDLRVQPGTWTRKPISCGTRDENPYR